MGISDPHPSWSYHRQVRPFSQTRVLRVLRWADVLSTVSGEGRVRLRYKLSATQRGFGPTAVTWRCSTFIVHIIHVDILFSFIVLFMLYVYAVSVMSSSYCDFEWSLEINKVYIRLSCG